jgi:hypothetical protein
VSSFLVKVLSLLFLSLSQAALSALMPDGGTMHRQEIECRGESTRERQALGVCCGWVESVALQVWRGGDPDAPNQEDGGQDMQ